MISFQTVSEFKDHKLSDWLSKNLLMFVSALCIYVSIFAGGFSVSRVFSSISPQWNIFGEIKTWAIVIGAIFVYLSWRKYSITRTNTIYLQRIWLSVGLIAVAQLALMAHALLYKSGASSIYFVWELATIILTTCLFGFAFQVWGIRLVNTVMWLGLSIALLFVAWMLAVTLSANKSDTAGILATTFTFHRIQIFGGFAAFVLLFESNKVVRAGVLALCATICFTAGYLTLSKAALLAGTGSTLFLAGVYVTWFSKIRAGAVLTVSITAVILFAFFSGGLFASRVSEGLLGTGYGLSLNAVLPPGPEDLTDLNVSPQRGASKATYEKFAQEDEIALNTLNFEAQKRIAEVVACTAGNYPCEFKIQRWEQDIADTMLRFRVYIPDFSFRIRLLMEGVRGIAEAPWMGNGFGTFNAVATNLYTKEPEEYSHPHNIVVELLYSVGIIGTVLIAGIIFVLFWLVMQMKEGIRTSLPMLAYVFSVFIGALFGGDYMDFRMAWFGLVICIMLCEFEAT